MRRKCLSISEEGTLMSSVTLTLSLSSMAPSLLLKPDSESENGKFASELLLVMSMVTGSSTGEDDLEEMEKGCDTGGSG